MRRAVRDPRAWRAANANVFTRRCWRFSRAAWRGVRSCRLRSCFCRAVSFHMTKVSYWSARLSRRSCGERAQAARQKPRNVSIAELFVEPRIGCAIARRRSKISMDHAVCALTSYCAVGALFSKACASGH